MWAARGTPGNVGGPASASEEVHKGPNIAEIHGSVAVAVPIQPLARGIGGVVRFPTAEGLDKRLDIKKTDGAVAIQVSGHRRLLAFIGDAVLVKVLGRALRDVALIRNAVGLAILAGAAMVAPDRKRGPFVSRATWMVMTALRAHVDEYVAVARCDFADDPEQLARLLAACFERAHPVRWNRGQQAAGCLRRVQ